MLNCYSIKQYWIVIGQQLWKMDDNNHCDYWNLGYYLVLKNKICLPLILTLLGLKQPNLMLYLLNHCTHQHVYNIQHPIGTLYSSGKPIVLWCFSFLLVSGNYDWQFSVGLYCSGYKANLNLLALHEFWRLKFAYSDNSLTDILVNRWFIYLWQHYR